jgi:predicted ATPase
MSIEESPHFSSAPPLEQLSVAEKGKERPQKGGCENPLERGLRQARTDSGTLYGRDEEQHRILEAYLRIRDIETQSNNDEAEILGSELVLISGPLGIGKSCLARSIRHRVEEMDMGYLMSSKFHPLQRIEPHMAFVEALSDFAIRALDRRDASHFRKTISLHGRNNEYCLLLDVIPSLKTLLGDGFDRNTSATKETESSTTSNSESPSIERDDTASNDDVKVEVSTDHRQLLALRDDAQSQKHQYHTTGAIRRLKSALQALVRAIATPNKPLVWILDDLQWADEYSLAVMKALLDDRAIKGVLFIGTYAGDLNNPEERIKSSLSRLQESNVPCCRLALEPLHESAIAHMLAETLHEESDRVRSLSSFLHSRTGGNAYSVWALLADLYEHDLLSFDKDQVVWDMDLLPQSTFTVHSVIQSKMQRLNVDDQKGLQIAACLGSTLHRRILTGVLSPPEPQAFTRLVERAASQGLLSWDETRNCWCFAHNVIQNAVYQTIPEHERCTFHYRIGRKLWRMLDLSEMNQYIFLIVDQLTYSMECLVEQQERTAVAKLCLCAGIQAVELSSFCLSAGYLERGIALLDPRSWRDDYELSLDLYSAAAEVSNSLGRFDRVQDLVAVTVQNGRSLGDTVRAQASLVHALGSNGNFAAALKMGLDLLEKLGEPLPRKLNRMRIATEFISLRRRLKAKSSEAILRFPHMANNEKLAAMQLLNLVFFYALIEGFENVPLIGFRLVRLTLDYGLCAVSCVGFVLFSATLFGYVPSHCIFRYLVHSRTDDALALFRSVGKDFTEGERIGQLSFSLYEKFDTKAWLARLSVFYFDFVHGWMRPLDSGTERLKEACQAGLESGDIEFALACELVYLYNHFESENLTRLVRQWELIEKLTALYGQGSALLMTVAVRQLMQNLMDKSTQYPHLLNGSFLNETRAQLVNSNPLLFAWTQIQMALLNILFGRYSEASLHAKNGRPLATNTYGPQCGGFNVFLCGFADVACARQQHSGRAKYAKRCSRQLLDSANRGETLYFIGKHYLLEAELAALAGKTASARTLYIVAISTSQKAGLKMQTALANERAARFVLNQGDRERSLHFFREALAWYRAWGATVKAEHLEREMDAFDLSH